MHELRQLTADPVVGEAAELALYLVDWRGADPRLLLAVIERAKDGWPHLTKAERDRQRYLDRLSNPPDEDPSAHGPERDPREFR